MMDGRRLAWAVRFLLQFSCSSHDCDVECLAPRSIRGRYTATWPIPDGAQFCIDGPNTLPCSKQWKHIALQGLQLRTMRPLASTFDSMITFS